MQRASLLLNKEFITGNYTTDKTDHKNNYNS